jgi:hypothetical protein
MNTIYLYLSGSYKWNVYGVSQCVYFYRNQNPSTPTYTIFQIVNEISLSVLN